MTEKKTKRPRETPPDGRFGPTEPYGGHHGPADSEYGPTVKYGGDDRVPVDQPDDSDAEDSR